MAVAFTLLYMKYSYIKLKVILIPYLPMHPEFLNLKLRNVFSNHEGCEH